MEPESRTLLNAILELPEPERAAIARELLANLPPEDGEATTEPHRGVAESMTDSEAEPPWPMSRAEEIESLRVSIEEVRAGKVVPAEQVLTELREILNEGRSESARIQ